MAKHTDHYAIVIGINEYSQLPRLKAAERDAVSFTECLRSAAGGGLPRQNIFLLSSPPLPPSNPFDAKPVQQDVDAALARFGVGRQEHIGRRLYFYFSGHAIGATFDDVVLLMADASPSRLNHGISLRQYRQFFRESGHFTEVVFVLDCARSVAAGVSVNGVGPSFVLPDGGRRVGGSDFILMNAAYGGWEVQSETGEQRGVLTRAVTEGLSGEAIDAWGRITALSLSNYVRWRVPKLAGGASVRQVPEILLPDEAMVFSQAKEKRLSQGRLVVEVPYWSAVVRVYDNCFRALPVGPVKEDKKGLYVSEMELPEGIYRVEISLENKSRNQLVSVRSDEVTRVGRDVWGDLKLESSAPLAGTADTYKRHMTPASEWSRKLTWKEGPGGSSRLFLFVHTLEPKRHPMFAEGLRLLDENGKEVTDFSTGVKLNTRAGWMAFCANLPPGFYMLRQGRRGLRVRYQPLYLCAGWQTQVFLTAQTGPSLRSMTLNMASFKRGFLPDDEASLAAEAVLEGMKHGLTGEQLANWGRLDALLQGKFENPWLGILAAYALRAREDIPSEKRTGPAGKSNAGLLRQVMKFLTTIKDHPDVRALELKEGRKAQPFSYPPLLYAGLKLVQRHATQCKDTIPLGSLTDRILDKLLINSHWTAWAELEAEESQGQAAAPKRGARPRAYGRPEQLVTTAAASYIQSRTPKAPVFPFEAIDEDEPPDPVSQTAAGGTVHGATAYSSAQLINLARQLTENRNLDDLNEKESLSHINKLDDLLQKLDLRKVSAAIGLPLSRTEESVRRLRESSAGQVGQLVAADAVQALLSLSQQAILEYVLKLSAKLAAKKSDDSVQGAPQEEAADAPAMDEGGSKVQAPPAVSIEECVFKIRAEADRIMLKYEAGDGGQVVEGKEKALNLAERMRVVGVSLLERAAFTAITDTQGRIRSINGAFEFLLSPPGSTQAVPEPQRKANKQAWEKALASAPLGSSTITNPISDPSVSPGLKVLTLRRTAIEDDTAGSVRAYLNALRGKGARGVPPSLLQELDSLLPELSLHASFFAYDTGPRLVEHLQKLEEMTARLEHLTEEGA